MSHSACDFIRAPNQKNDPARSFFNIYFIFYLLLLSAFIRVHLRLK
jgi:hypothetical protein